jgi:transitional endoplasmic reticulum ATPase
MIGAPQARLRERLFEGAPLALYGLVQDRGRSEYGLSDIALAVLRSPLSAGPALRKKLLGERRRATLQWTDFAHVEGHEVALDLIAAALHGKERGVGVLLHGAPGVGKTEFACALGARLGAEVVFAGEYAHSEGVEPTRAARIGAIALTGVLARQAGATIVVVDEANDIFTGVDVSDGAARKGSKAFMNRFVEACDAPTIWITNAPQRLGPAILRRMTYVLRFPDLNRAARRRIVDRIVRRSALALDVQEREALAGLAASPAVLANALRTAKLSGARPSSCAVACLRAIDGEAPTQAPAPFAFDASLIRADHDLLALRERVARCGTLALSFCFHGAPGSGKSAFARHLAQEMGLDVLEKRASDILSKWVGEAERAIRLAFEEASDRRAFLIFDEADSLLASRARAQHSWEVTQVNELLVAMERHTLPFACSTNAFDALDPATMRRFLFKVKFLAMGPEQIATAFRAAFAQEAPARLLALDNLTPGDFALVARKARVLDCDEATTLAHWLAEESAAKPDAGKRRIGF